jgi:methionyl-tRNA formyltransferase
MRIVLIAEESVGIRVLNELSRLPHEIVTVVAQEPAEGDLDARCVWNSAKQLGFGTWPAHRVNEPELAAWIKKDVELVLNVHSLFILREEVLEAASIGVFNLHPGPLPQYAGLSSPSWAIYNGECKHAVTLHRVVPKIDAGDIVFEHFFDIEDKDTGLTVFLRCIQFGIPMVLRLVELAARDPASIPYRPQDLSKRGYYGRDAPQEGKIRWDLPARRVCDFIRASDYAPFPSPWGLPLTTYEGREVGVSRAALTGEPSGQSPGFVRHNPDGTWYVSCADEWLKVVRMVESGEWKKPGEILTSESSFES